MTPGAEVTPYPAPRANPDLVGHAPAERTLREAFEGGRLAHAWLITGPRGIGKATLAYRFARFALTHGKAAFAPGLFGAGPPAAAGEGLFVGTADPVFRRVAAGGHADLFTVERTLNDQGRLRGEIIVSDVRGVGAFLALTPAEGGWRVVVVDAAEEMNRNAANAILKVLEEPPKRAMLLLVSHAPGRLLPTIHSRCRRLALRVLAPDDVTALIARYRPDIEPADRDALAHLAEGSIGRALALAEEGGVELYRELARLLEGLGALDIAALHALAERLGRADGEEAFRTLGDLLLWWLGRLILFGARGAPPAGMGASERALMTRLLQRAALDRWMEVWEKITRLLARAGGANLDRKQVFLNAFLDIERAARS